MQFYATKSRNVSAMLMLAGAMIVSGSIVTAEKVTVNYHRYDGDYQKASLWVWDLREQKDPDFDEVFVSEKTDYGVQFVIDTSLYGNDDSDADKIGFIPRLRQDWNTKDGGDRAWTPKLGNEIWLVGNDPKIYTEKPDISPKIVFARIDTPKRIDICLSHSVPVKDADKIGFKMVDEAGEEVAISRVRPVQQQRGKTYFFELNLDEVINHREPDYTVSAEEYQPVDVTIGDVVFNTEYYPIANCGVVVNGKETTAKIFSPSATEVSLVIYDEAVGDEGRREIPMESYTPATWEVTVPENLYGKYYRYLVNTPRYGEKEVLDPYAKNTTGIDGNARITDVRSLDPEDFRPIKRVEYGNSPTDAIIYEVHIRDFTISDTSGVEEDNRGKYLGFAESGTTLPGNEHVATGIDYLKELGVTHVQILPP